MNEETQCSSALVGSSPLPGTYPSACAMHAYHRAHLGEGKSSRRQKNCTGCTIECVFALTSHMVTVTQAKYILATPI